MRAGKQIPGPIFKIQDEIELGVYLFKVREIVLDGALMWNYRGVITKNGYIVKYGVITERALLEGVLKTGSKLAGENPARPKSKS